MSFNNLPNLFEEEEKRMVSKGLKPLDFKEPKVESGARFFQFPEINTLSTNPNNTILIFGHCLTKDNEYEEDPISIADAIFAQLFSKLSIRFPNSMVVYPDSEYERYSKEIRMRRHDAKKLSKVTLAYENFHRRTLPRHVQLIRTSQFGEYLQVMKDKFRHFASSATSFYGWKKPTEKQKELVYECAVDELALPYLFFGGNRDILVFAYPDEICSVRVAQKLLSEDDSLAASISLLSPMPIKGVNSRRDMVDSSRGKRIHLNEPEESVREKYQLMMACNTTIPDQYINPEGCEMFYLLNNTPNVQNSTISEIRAKCPFVGRLCYQTAIKSIKDFQS